MYSAKTKKRFIKVFAIATKKPKSFIFQRFRADFGAPSGTRTLDTLIKSQVLYQLS
jgi:hypothetical protein